MNKAWLRDGALLVLLLLAGGWASQAIGHQAWWPAGVQAWWPAGVVVAMLFLRGAIIYIVLGFALLALGRFAGLHWLAAALFAALGAASAYLCTVAIARFAPNEPRTPSVRGVVVSLLCALMLLAPAFALLQLLQYWPAQALSAGSARGLRQASGLALSLNLSHVSPHAGWNVMSALATHWVQSALAIVLLAPAAWLWALRASLPWRRFAWALAANLASYAALTWLAQQANWPLTQSAAAALAASLGVLALVIAAGGSERAELERQVRQAAVLDPLTALPTRPVLLRELELALAHARRERDELSVLLVDLDGCKRVNATASRDLGDSLLLEGARRLARTLRHRSRLYRLGGDEFIVLLEGVGELEAPAQLAANLIESMRAPFVLDGRELTLSCSIGISHFPRDAQSAPELIKLAGVAVSAAERAGPNTQRAYEPALQTQAHEQDQLDEALRRAHARDELSVLYRPHASLRSGRIIALEARAYLQRADASVTSGEQLAEALRRCGLIEAAGERVIERVCAQLGAWRARHGASVPPVILPVTAQQLLASNFGDVLVNALNAHNLAGEQIWLDLVDLRASDDMPRLRAVLNEIDALGVRLRMDFDEANWAQWIHLRLSAIALTPNLLDELEEPRAQNVIRALMQCARALQSNIVAKGVTSATQLETLRNLGVDQYEGPLLSPPLSAEEAERWCALQQHRFAFVASVSYQSALEAGLASRQPDNTITRICRL